MQTIIIIFVKQDDQTTRKEMAAPLNNGLVNEMLNHTLISSSEFVQSVYMWTMAMLVSLTYLLTYWANITTTNTNTLRIHYDFHEMTQSQSVFSCEQSVILLNFYVH